jgi:hypothetical protein
MKPIKIVLKRESVIGKGNKRDEFDQNLLCRFTEIAQ